MGQPKDKKYYDLFLAKLLDLLVLWRLLFFSCLFEVI